MGNSEGIQAGEEDVNSVLHMCLRCLYSCLSHILGGKCMSHWPFENQGSGSDAQQARMNGEVNRIYYRNYSV